MHSYIRPYTHIALRLPSGIVKVLEIIPNTNINIGKFGTFPANLLLGRPYYLTFELLDKEEGKSQTELRVVPASELHAETLASDDAATPVESKEEPTADGGVQFDIVGENGEVIMRNNRLTVDDPSRQTLSMEEIEELKKAGTGSGKEIIAKIMASHMALEEKTKFSLAKYSLRKAKKYLRRFTVLPLDVGTLAEYVLEKEPFKVMELREESLGLIGAWANIHCGDSSRVLTAHDGISQIGGGRWLVVDDTAGLVVASLAEKMGILYSPEEESEGEEEEEEEVLNLEKPQNGEPTETGSENPQQDTEMPDIPTDASSAPQTASNPNSTTKPTPSLSSSLKPFPRKPHRNHIPAMSSPTNTLTILHPNAQPNLALLKYFNFDACDPSPTHPLYHHLKSLSWLQLLSPTSSDDYREPPLLSDSVLAEMKSSKRSTYYKKRRRWERTKRVVDETRRGGFDGVVVAGVMSPESVLRWCVPLVKGGGRVVVYSNTVEPLVELCDLYSKDRRAAFVQREVERQEAMAGVKKEGEENGTVALPELDEEEDLDFPVNPTLLLAPTLQTSRARDWQVLPGRTHPLMTSKGGAEGYLFTATRVLPLEGKVEARGNFRGKKRKTGEKTAVPT
ncbi:eukaryotic translation initiation factor-like protein 3 [Delitschia confertaspora ATCC 74209]|uniref:tRNA (adenine(58)-N(1))-methyltransferase non-catalytic subunit TRM6 n=1 Tax=Delitschia confertaspora ATCC 74209 TaxID=1513339 RepID=A0A9P4JVQ7_9PLEO|nr:eukaryotic translation initiation factor-like protein 3 [Delitschia confertaspora ATCC 74209]